jgi:hypothetical protein
MINIFVKLTCGCCEDVMQFESEDSAIDAFDKVGLGHHDMIDDAGVLHTGVDTFYGYSLVSNEMESRGLGYLFERLGDTVE